jgi:YD repeat-containing protein
MFCPCCGSKIEDGHSFCCKCGTPAPAATTQAMPQPPVDPAPSVSPEVPSNPPKKKSVKKTIIAVTAIVTALALVIGVGAYFLLGRKDAVYLCTSMTSYDTDGECISAIEYEYNEQGSPLLIKKTTPKWEETPVWDEELGAYVYVLGKKIGKRVLTTEYSYNDEGHCTYHEQVLKTYNLNGKLEDTKTLSSTKYPNYTYHYNDDGTIKSIDHYSLELGGGTGSLLGKLRYHYDDDGRLVEISDKLIHHDTIQYYSDYRYDDEGRLIAYTNRKVDGMYIYEFEYNKDGQLEYVAQLKNQYQAPLDNDHVTESDYKAPSTDHELKYEAEFEYDSKGNLISRKVYDGNGNLLNTTECNYEGRKMISVEYDSLTVIFVNDEDDADDLDSNTVAMIRDKHGNIAKAINSDGSYTEFEYEAIKLSKEDVQQFQSTEYCVNRIDSMGLTDSYGIAPFGGSVGYVTYVSFPTTDLYQLDVLIKKYLIR